MGGAQAEFKKAMFALATKCQGMAETTNANHAVIQQITSAIREGEKRQDFLLKQVDGIKVFLEQSVGMIESSYKALETNCGATISKMAEHHKEAHAQHGVCITSL
jgi:hypothetical protein